MMPEDVAELDEYIKQQGLVIISSRSSYSVINQLNSLNESGAFKAYIILEEQIEQIRLTYFDEIQMYVVDEMQSPVIEFRISKFNSETKKFNRGRLFYKSEMIDENGVPIPKSSMLTKTANDLFIWFKKNFSDIKINPNFTTERSANWVKQNDAVFEIN